MAGRPKKIQQLELLTEKQKLDKIRSAFYDNICFQDRMDIDEWADKYRMLPKETSHEHGLWSTARFPFLRRIMKCLSPSSIASMIVWQKAHQVGAALDLSTPILTELGWKTIGTVAVGDRVYGPEGKLTNITFISEVFHDHACYAVDFVNRERIVADAGHKWVVEDCCTGDKETLTTEEIYRSGRSYKIKVANIEGVKDSYNKSDYHYIFIIRPVETRPVRCLQVDNESHLFLVTKSFIATHNTELALNWMLYCADHNPGPMVYCQKTEEAVKKFSNQKLKPGIKACEKVYDTLGEGKPKDLPNSVSNKAYPGGFISLGPANSAEFLKSVSSRYGVTDEEDSYEQSSGTDGTPWKMLQKRMSNFPDRKLYRPSTPKFKETSTVEPGYLAGSQEQYYVPCPHCNPGADDLGFMFVIKWDDMKWSKEIDKRTGYPVETWLECPGCLGKIEEGRHKTWMLAKGDWFSEKNSPGERYRVGDVVNPSFHLSSLYSPYGFYAWSDAVIDWFDYLVKKDINLLQVFVNQVLGETFELSGHEISYNMLYNRREYYGSASRQIDVPIGGLCLTAGVDVQQDRIEAEIVAWGLYDECWGVEYVVLMGDTSQVGDRYGMLKDGQPSVWLLLDQYLSRRWQHESGSEMLVECTMIDAQYRTKEVNYFCRPREHRRIFPIHGKEGWGRALVSCDKTRHRNYKTYNYIAAVDQLKDKLRSQLLVDEEGAGFCHFPMKDCYGEKYFKGLTCETRETKLVAGKRKLYWRNPSGARNEPTDLRNYAYSALIAYPVNMQQRSLAPSPVAAIGAPVQRKRRAKPRGSAGIS